MNVRLNKARHSTNPNYSSQTNSVLGKNYYNDPLKTNASQQAFSFHPSVKHDKNYINATPHDRSLSRIREKYMKEKDMYYGVNMSYPI